MGILELHSAGGIYNVQSIPYPTTHPTANSFHGNVFLPLGSFTVSLFLSVVLFFLPKHVFSLEFPFLLETTRAELVLKYQHVK